MARTHGARDPQAPTQGRKVRARECRSLSLVDGERALRTENGDFHSVREKGKERTAQRSTARACTVHVHNNTGTHPLTHCLTHSSQLVPFAQKVQLLKSDRHWQCRWSRRSLGALTTFLAIVCYKRPLLQVCAHCALAEPRGRSSIALQSQCSRVRNACGIRAIESGGQADVTGEAWKDKPPSSNPKAYVRQRVGQAIAMSSHLATDRCGGVLRSADLTGGAHERHVVRTRAAEC